jgi:UDP-N-acetylmuramate dehydrogenase
MLQHVSLQPYNTFGISQSAEFFAAFSSLEELQSLLLEAKEKAQPVKILGGGSNVLLTKDIRGVVLKNEMMGKRLLQETPTHFLVKVGAGESWHGFTQWCVENNYQGIENLSLIPGTVGAAPMQNIGAYGVEIKDVFESLEALEMETGTVKTFTKQDCAFGYRESIFKKELKDKYIITSVTFSLHKIPNYQYDYGDVKSILATQFKNVISAENISKTVIQIRESKLPNPAEIGNAGSFFKNPVVDTILVDTLKKQFENIPAYVIDAKQSKVPAGWLIEQCGWKGFTENNYGVHAKQALVLVNYGGASGHHIYDVSTRILNSVQEKFGILLEREVNIW